MDIDRKFTQLFGKDPKEQPFMANMSDARARLIRKAQYDAFVLGVEVGYKMRKEEEDGVDDTPWRAYAGNL